MPVFAPKVYQCRRAPGPLELDGNLDKPFWEGASWTCDFADIEGDIRPAPRYRTRAKMLWDDQNLYIGAELMGEEIWANVTRRDDVIFRDNDFEVFIDPNSDTQVYCEFEMNARNTVWDLLLTKAYRDGGDPMNGFDLFVYMAAAVCLRGRQETLNVFNALKAELSAYIASGRSTYPAKQSYRILYEGIACWPYLYQMQLPLIAQGINMVGSMYVNTFGIVYEGLDEMARAYAEIPNSVPLSLGLEMRKQLVRRTKPDGIVLHISRCCKIWCGTYYEMERHFADAGVATMTFDGDQADARNFSPAQYETRLQAFKEIIEDNRRG